MKKLILYSCFVFLVMLLGFISYKAMESFSLDGKVIDSERKSLSGHYHCVRSLSFSPDGKKLASGSEDSTVKIWDTANWNVVSTIALPFAVMSVAYSPNGKYLAVGTNEMAILYDEGGQELKKVRIWEIEDTRAC